MTLNDKLRGLLRAIAVRHAIKRELDVLPEERATSAEAKQAAAELIGSVHMAWWRERKEIGL